jgi:hypothetical protein
MKKLVFDVTTFPPEGVTLKETTLPAHIHVATTWTSSCPSTYIYTGLKTKTWIKRYARTPLSIIWREPLNRLIAEILV